jgi:hypothetical protein
MTTQPAMAAEARAIEMPPRVDAPDVESRQVEAGLASPAANRTTPGFLSIRQSSFRAGLSRRGPGRRNSEIPTFTHDSFPPLKPIKAKSN